MQSIQSVLKNFNPVEDKYISREFQSYGIYLSQALGDEDHKSLYIKLAKTVPRAILDKALSFVSDANARSKVKLFMWKMKELRTANKDSSPYMVPVHTKKKPSKKQQKKKDDEQNLALF